MGPLKPLVGCFETCCRLRTLTGESGPSLRRMQLETLSVPLQATLTGIDSSPFLNVNRSPKDPRSPEQLWFLTDSRRQFSSVRVQLLARSACCCCQKRNAHRRRRAVSAAPAAAVGSEPDQPSEGNIASVHNEYKHSVSHPCVKSSTVVTSLVRTRFNT